jgi:hypothetical protein
VLQRRVGLAKTSLSLPFSPENVPTLRLRVPSWPIIDGDLEPARIGKTQGRLVAARVSRGRCNSRARTFQT